MKIVTILLLACTTILLAETKTEAELRKQLAAAHAALSVERAEKAALKSGTQQLKEAVQAVAQTSKESGQKVEAGVDRILESQESGKKAVEKVAAATQVATKNLTDAVTTTRTAVTSAITSQTRQQEKLLTQARDAARKAEESNRDLAIINEENRKAKEEMAKQLSAARADITEIKFNQALAAARDDTALRMQRMKVISDIATPFIQGLCGILLALVVVFQIKATRQATATHTMVNGERAKMLKEKEDDKRRIEELEKQIDDRKNGHPST